LQYFDVLNGDADGICALQQMRLAQPLESTLITGIKRDIQLVKKVEAGSGDRVLVLDISLSRNADAVNGLLQSGCAVQYFDHHLSGDIPQSNLFESHIDTNSNICTSLLVNDYLEGKYALWAVCGAYGDNMNSSADILADGLGLSSEQKLKLKQLGILINYNGYGASLDDLHFIPDDLYRAISPYQSPFEFIEKEAVYTKLKSAYEQDMELAASLKAAHVTDTTAVFILPAEKWCRRVSGVLGNQLSNQFPERAHALLTDTGENAYQVSVRAPQINKTGAGALCSQFETGGGREGAAGINHLPYADKVSFIEAFQSQYSK